MCNFIYFFTIFFLFFSLFSSHLLLHPDFHLRLPFYVHHLHPSPLPPSPSQSSLLLPIINFNPRHHRDTHVNFILSSRHLLLPPHLHFILFPYSTISIIPFHHQFSHFLQFQKNIRMRAKKNWRCQLRILTCINTYLMDGSPTLSMFCLNFDPFTLK